MNISKEHIERAERIDTFVTAIFKNGGSEEQILMNMAFHKQTGKMFQVVRKFSLLVELF